MPEHWKAIRTAEEWQFLKAAVTAPILAKEPANLIFQGFPQLHFVGNQVPQWDVIHCDGAAKIVFLTLPCPLFYLHSSHYKECEGVVPKSDEGMDILTRI